jgi:hypothetical protein
MPDNGEPFFCTTGCHTGSFADFDHFCDVMNVTEDELPEAFAAWLGRRFDWDGRYERIES